MSIVNHARADLWEPCVGNHPGPPGLMAEASGRVKGDGVCPMFDRLDLTASSVLVKTCELIRVHTCCRLQSRGWSGGAPPPRHSAPRHENFVGRPPKARKDESRNRRKRRGELARRIVGKNV